MAGITKVTVMAKVAAAITVVVAMMAMPVMMATMVATAMVATIILDTATMVNTLIAIIGTIVMPTIIITTNNTNWMISRQNKKTNKIKKQLTHTVACAMLSLYTHSIEEKKKRKEP